MCGIIGIISNIKNKGLLNEIYYGLLGLQHRGQDTIGICNEYVNFRSKGLVKSLQIDNDLFTNDNMFINSSNVFMGHIRYLTSGNNDEKNIQPLDSKYDDTIIKLCHNGNIINLDEIKNIILNECPEFENIFNFNFNEGFSDTHIILNIIKYKLLYNTNFNKINNDEKGNKIRDLSRFLHNTLKGSYNLLIYIEGYGLVVIKDKYGIKPLVLGVKKINNTSDINGMGINSIEHIQYILASEDNIFGNLGYERLKDVEPGETIILEYYSSTNDIVNNPISIHTSIKFTTFNYYSSEFSTFKVEPKLSPCLFEYIYLSSSDSKINNINVYTAREKIGQILGNKIKHMGLNDIDIIVPVPETGRIFAYGVQQIFNIPIVEALVKNKYINRTFIMENENLILESIRKKFTIIGDIVKGKNILLVDDSIVRGNTSRRICELFRMAGVNKIYFSSAAPRILYPNYYGINISTKEELVCNNRNDSEVASYINADYVIFNDLDIITTELKKINKKIENFEVSIFNNQHLYSINRFT